MYFSIIVYWTVSLRPQAMETTSADKDLAVMKQQPGLKQGMGQGMPHRGSHENGSHFGGEIKNQC